MTEVLLKTCSLSVVLPAFNEGPLIYHNTKQVCKTLEGFDYEVIVVDDGSKDNTYQEALRASEEGLPVHVICLEANKGKGSALIYGAANATKEYCVFLDADLEIDPENILCLYDKMQETGADIIIGIKDPRKVFVPPFRRVMSIIYQNLISLLFEMPLHDTQTGIKIFRKEVLQSCVPVLKVSRFAFDVELLVVANRFGFNILEQSVGLSYKRKASLERIKPKQILKMFFDTLSIYYRASFWRWLRPGLTAKIWMIGFIAGVFLFGMGIAKILTPMVLATPIKTVFYYLALQFLPLPLRDWLLVLAGLVIFAVSGIKLNNILLRSFTRLDKGDLAAILTSRRRNDTPD